MRAREDQTRGGDEERKREKKGRRRRLKAQKKKRRKEGSRNSVRDKRSQTIVIQWSKRKGKFAPPERTAQRIERDGGGQL